MKTELLQIGGGTVSYDGEGLVALFFLATIALAIFILVSAVMLFRYFIKRTR